MEGWIKLHRKLLEWEWYRDSNTLHLFLHLLLQANHGPTKWRGVVVERGQILTGRHKLKEQTGLSEQSIRTSITRLKSTNEITSQTTNSFSIITICKYNEYQINEKEINQRTGKKPNQRVTNEQPTSNHIQELKNDKKVKKEDKDLPGLPDLAPTIDTITKDTITKEREAPEWIPKETLEAFISMRKSIKKPLTPHAITLLVSKLQKLKDSGEDIKAVLEQSILSSYQGVFEVKKPLTGGKYGNSGGIKPPAGKYDKVAVRFGEDTGSNKAGEVQEGE